MALSPPSPHVLLVAAPLQGHINPLLVLGRRLASRGLLVTITTVPHAGLKLRNGDDGASVSIGRGTLRFEHLRGGGLWTSDDRVGSDVMNRLEDEAPAALAELVRRQEDAGLPVTCVVANAFAPWAGCVACGLGIPHAVLWTESCAVLLLYYQYFHSLADFPAAAAGPTAPDPRPRAVRMAPDAQPRRGGRAGGGPRGHGAAFPVGG
jgi:gallate 1-beta-glucosyltransferase